jgi:hypothetical protein
MPFNGPIDGKWDNVDYQQAPWAAGVATLTHDECVHVLAGFEEVTENYDPSKNYYEPISDFYIQSEYNKLDWQYAINGETYEVVKNYDPEVNTLGIDPNGIIPEEVVEEEPEEPTEEDPTEEDTTEVVEEETPEAPIEETTTEDPAE